MERVSDKQKILIVDDSEMNRSILADMLGDEYEILEAENGSEGVAMLQTRGSEISLVLLDIVMPGLDGFGVLNMMNKNGWIEDIPVIMISAESGSSHVERAFDLGVTDFISRPFDALIVHRRVVNTILLYAKQKKLVSLVAEQIYEKERRSNLMIDILSHIVEFRNGESGMHVRHVHILTETLLTELMRRTDKYRLTPADISVISTASALHDIGKIAIPEEILNKPGRFTDEEFAIMKKHSMYGADMLEALPFYQDEPLVKAAYEICRWHHERWDGRGYPDGLKEDEIPISAQMVALADVYDALTSERVYKPAYPHEKAIGMILNGECGTFNPLVMECLRDCADLIRDELAADSAVRQNQREMQSVARELHKHEELTASERTLELLEHERMKYSFFAAMTEEVQFEYTVQPPMVTLTAWGAEKLGLELVVDDMGFTAALTAVQNGESDIAMAGISITPDRQEVMDFSDSYATGVQVVIVTEDSAITSVDDLFAEGASHVIGVQRNTTGDIYTTDDIEKKGLGSIDRYSKGADAVQALKTGKVDCVVIDNEPAKSFVAEVEGLKILETEYITEDYAAAMSKDNTALYEAVNTALEELLADGTIQSIIDKYIAAE